MQSGITTPERDVIPLLPAYSYLIFCLRSSHLVAIRHVKPVNLVWQKSNLTGENNHFFTYHHSKTKSPCIHTVTLYSHYHCNSSKEHKLHSEVVTVGLITHNLWPKVSFCSASFAACKPVVSEDFPSVGYKSFKANLELWAVISPGITVGMQKPGAASMTTEAPAEAVSKAEHSPHPLPPLCLSLQQELRTSPNPQSLNTRLQ